jgi:hypothetical protein
LISSKSSPDCENSFTDLLYRSVNNTRPSSIYSTPVIKQSLRIMLVFALNLRVCLLCLFRVAYVSTTEDQSMSKGSVQPAPACPDPVSVQSKASAILYRVPIWSRLACCDMSLYCIIYGIYAVVVININTCTHTYASYSQSNGYVCRLERWTIFRRPYPIPMCLLYINTWYISIHIRHGRDTNVCACVCICVCVRVYMQVCFSVAK